MSAGAQDAVVGAALLAPLGLVALVLLPGHRPAPLVAALILRHRAVSVIFVALIALSIALGTGLLAQERAIRTATARAADPFDIVVAAPGSELTVLFATVFLQASDMELIGGEVLQDLAADDRVALAAPLGFGDSVDGAPIVGTTADLVRHLSGDGLEGRIWQSPFEAIAGSAVAAAIGSHLEPAHGVGEIAAEDAHDGAQFTLVGRMAPTGTPWDRAILVPIEAVWQVHGFADGHRETGRLGPPFVPDLMPGVPAIVVAAKSLGGAYSLRAAFTRDGETMAFFPGTVLAQLHGVMGDVRGAMSAMAMVSQGLVAGSVLCGLAIVARLFRRQLALLAALGAPGRFVVAVMWLHAMTHLLAGAAIGLLLGQLAAGSLSAFVSRSTGLELAADLGVAELLAVAAFLGLASLAALLPAAISPPVTPPTRCARRAGRSGLPPTQARAASRRSWRLPATATPASHLSCPPRDAKRRTPAGPRGEISGWRGAPPRGTRRDRSTPRPGAGPNPARASPEAAQRGAAIGGRARRTPPHRIRRLPSPRAPSRPS